MKIKDIFKRYLQFFQFLVPLALLLCGTADAAHYDIVVYMGHSQVFMFVADDDEKVLAKSIKGCSEDGYLWGDPSNMACNNSPVIVFNEALKEIASVWQPGNSERDDVSIITGIAAYSYNATKFNELSVDPATGQVKGYPEDTQDVLKSCAGRSGLNKGERFKNIFSGLVKQNFGQVKITKIVLDDEHTLIRQMAQDYLSGKNTFDLFHCATCGVPYYYREGVLKAVELSPKEQKACGYYELGFLSRKQDLEVAGVKETDVENIESGDRAIREKGNPFMKTINADPYVRDYHQYPGKVRRLGWSHKKFSGKHCFHRWMYTKSSCMTTTDSVKGFGMNDLGARIMATCTGTNQQSCCDFKGNAAFVEPDLYKTAQTEARRQVCEYPVQSMAKVIMRDFRLQAGNAYLPVTDSSDPCPVVVAGEFSYALPELQKMLVEKLDDYDKGRVQVIAGDEFLKRLPLAGINLLKQAR